MEKQIQALQEILDRGKRIVFLPARVRPRKAEFRTSRSVDGLYQQQYDYPPEEIISHHFLSRIRKNFTASTAAAWLYPNARPNAAHRLMAELEKPDVVWAS